jgi:hypothetical protein
MIGINWCKMLLENDARNEYYGYLPEVYQLKINKATKSEIANYLDWLY